MCFLKLVADYRLFLHNFVLRLCVCSPNICRLCMCSPNICSSRISSCNLNVFKAYFHLFNLFLIKVTCWHTSVRSAFTNALNVNLQLICVVNDLNRTILWNEYHCMLDFIATPVTVKVVKSSVVCLCSCYIKLLCIFRGVDEITFFVWLWYADILWMSTRGVRSLTRECRPVKLFAKHIKVEDQVIFMSILYT